MLEKPDHGEFRIRVGNEEALIQLAIQEASKNMERPGEYWLRMKGAVDVDGKSEEYQRIYHVDMFDLTLEITEEWDGVETARRTMTIQIEGHQE